MTDEMIMEAVKRGDLQQASLLFERYHKRIFNFLARMTTDRESAGDLTQNVFLRMMKYRVSYNGDRFESWIYRIARNVFADHYQTTKSKTSFIDIGKIHGQIPDSEDEEDHDEREKILHASLMRLPVEQRELLVLTRFQHMKYEEVAGMMNTTVSNVKVKVHRAIQKLKEIYFEMERTGV